MRDELPEADTGLAGERTDLAWNRTGLSPVAILGTLARSAAVHTGPLTVAALVLAAIGAGAWAFSLDRARHLARSTATGRRVAERHALTTITVGTIAIAAAGALVALAPSAP